MVPETIAAIATPAGTGALALVRVSGPEAAGVVGQLLGLDGDGARRALPPRRASLRRLRQGGETLDEAVVTRFEAPHSFTGEEVVELAVHGGVLVTQVVFRALLAAGARAAQPGEFTRRAFENGRLDLTQAEAIMDLIGAQSELARRAAQAQLGGQLGQKIQDLREDLLGVLAHVEAWIDFPEEDIDPASGEELRDRIGKLVAQVDGLLATGWRGRLLREGARVVLCGKPNAGKSSLLNHLSGYERAIVSATPGTTRDTLEEWLDWGGVPMRLVDTAGLRPDSADAIESEGMRRTRAEWERADLVVEIVDGSQPGAPDAELAEAQRRLGFRLLRVLNKRDLSEDSAWETVDGLRFSARMDAPEPLAAAIRDALETGAGLVEAELVSINARHQQALTRARAGLAASMEALEVGISPEFVAVELHEAMEALGEILGKLDVEELLGKIFATFCLGK